jgi:hypothetical protein
MASDVDVPGQVPTLLGNEEGAMRRWAGRRSWLGALAAGAMGLGVAASGQQAPQELSQPDEFTFAPDAGAGALGGEGGGGDAGFGATGDPSQLGEDFGGTGGGADAGVGGAGAPDDHTNIFIYGPNGIEEPPTTE